MWRVQRLVRTASAECSARSAGASANVSAQIQRFSRIIGDRKVAVAIVEGQRHCPQIQNQRREARRHSPPLFAFNASHFPFTKDQTALSYRNQLNPSPQMARASRNILFQSWWRLAAGLSVAALCLP